MTSVFNKNQLQQIFMLINTIDTSSQHISIALLLTHYRVLQYCHELSLMKLIIKTQKCPIKFKLSHKGQILKKIMSQIMTFYE